MKSIHRGDQIIRYLPIGKLGTPCSTLTGSGHWHWRVELRVALQKPLCRVLPWEASSGELNAVYSYLGSLLMSYAALVCFWSQERAPLNAHSQGYTHSHAEWLNVVVVCRCRNGPRLSGCQSQEEATVPFLSLAEDHSSGHELISVTA